jgi:predicted class III extradiol MEMO1 family dioxygenase
VLPPASATLLRFFDGQHSVRDVQVAICEATGEIVPSGQIQSFIDKLDQGLYLETAGFRQRQEEIRHQYAASQIRSARFAGQAYQPEPEELRRQLDESFQTPGGPGLPRRAVKHAPDALVAPHIDPLRGGAHYAQAYATVWGAPVQRVIILGICHAGSRSPFILTRKDFATPLGIAKTDQGLIDQLVAQLDWDPLQEEELHRAEHSVEFQILYLQHALSEGGQSPLAESVRYVPLLCSFPWRAFSPAGRAGSEVVAQIDQFLETLASLLQQDSTGLLLVAGVDLAHMGRRFGDAGSLSDRFLARLRSQDLATLARLAEGDRQGFVDEMIGEADGRRICGFPALFSLLTLLPGAQGRVLGYDQSVDPSGGSVVSFAALTYEAAARSAPPGPDPARKKAKGQCPEGH